jgi:type II secretory pathway predicted ATPase ExeA
MTGRVIMYRSFYGLTAEPFSKEIDVTKLFQHSNLKELESRLSYMKRYRGIMLITGNPGTGKTTAIRAFINSLNSSSFFPIYMPLATVAIRDFYKQINDKLHGESLQSKSLLFKSIQQRILFYTNQQNKVPVIILDEVHLLKNENFFELQIITNFDIDSHDPALFILVAQSHLNDRFSRTILDSFNQRISMKFHFNPLNLEETKKYVIHNLKATGSSETIFNEKALVAIFNLSGGVIRKIGKLTVKTLTLGALTKKQKLTEEEVLLASKEL